MNVNNLKVNGLNVLFEGPTIGPDRGRMGAWIAAPMSRKGLFDPDRFFARSITNRPHVNRAQICRNLHATFTCYDPSVE